MFHIFKTLAIFCIVLFRFLRQSRWGSALELIWLICYANALPTHGTISLAPTLAVLKKVHEDSLTIVSVEPFGGLTGKDTYLPCKHETADSIPSVLPIHIKAQFLLCCLGSKASKDVWSLLHNQVWVSTKAESY